MMLPLAFLPEKRFMLRALELAQEAADAGEVPVGAVVVKEGRVIGEGRNRREAGKTALAHAELEAIHQALPNPGQQSSAALRLVRHLGALSHVHGGHYQRPRG